MTTTDDRPAVTCPSWCAECQQPEDDGTRVHFTSVVSLPGDDPEDMPTLDDLSRVWALAENHDAPSYCIHISRIMTAAEVRETAAQLLAFVDRVEALQRGDRTETLVLDALAPMLRELREVRDLPDDDPRRQAALEEKRRLLDLVDHYESA